ncbi:MAG: zinc-binding dehydrogenase [Chitinophagaceae bacterium]|nr:zinc-binding dehydrogenase [Chitinophagaceae bacterium]
MKAIYLTKQGDAFSSFEQREVPKPKAGKGQALIKVEAFGLNFADVMARRGMYKEAPPLPCLLGYDVAGTIEQLGDGVTGFSVGDRVMAMTRFGGYAEYALTEALAMAKIPTSISSAAATALTTQYCTAYYASAYVTNLFAGDSVLVQAGAGGVGTALIQYAKYKGCQIFATAGSSDKIEYLKKCGVHHPINYKSQDFVEEVKKVTGKNGVDIVFDAVGGKSVKKGMTLLNSGGRLVCYGAADLSDKNIFGKLKSVLDFGIYHPLFLMMPSKAIIGVNMLKIADNKPQIIQHCLQKVVDLVDKGVFVPEVGQVFKPAEIGAAHDFLEKRKSIGKVVVQW